MTLSTLRTEAREELDRFSAFIGDKLEIIYTHIPPSNIQFFGERNVPEMMELRGSGAVSEESLTYNLLAQLRQDIDHFHTLLKTTFLDDQEMLQVLFSNGQSCKLFQYLRVSKVASFVTQFFPSTNLKLEKSNIEWLSIFKKFEEFANLHTQCGSLLQQLALILQEHASFFSKEKELYTQICRLLIQQYESSPYDSELDEPITELCTELYAIPDPGMTVKSSLLDLKNELIKEAIRLALQGHVGLLWAHLSLYSDGNSQNYYGGGPFKLLIYILKREKMLSLQGREIFETVQLIHNQDARSNILQYLLDQVQSLNSDEMKKLCQDIEQHLLLLPKVERFVNTPPEKLQELLEEGEAAEKEHFSSLTFDKSKNIQPVPWEELGRLYFIYTAPTQVV